MPSPVNRSRSNFVELESLMRHAIFQNHKTLGSAEDFAIFGHGSNHGHVSKTIFTKLRSIFPRELHIKFGLDWLSGFEKSYLRTMIIHMYM